MWSDQTQQAMSCKRRLPADTTTDRGFKHQKREVPSNSYTNNHYLHQYQSWSQIPTAATNITPTVQHDLRKTSYLTAEPSSYPVSHENHTINGAPVLSTTPSRSLGGDPANFNVGSTFKLLSSIRGKTIEQPQRFYDNDSTVAIRAEIHNHVRGPLPPLPMVCGRCGRSDLDFPHLLKHQKSPYCLDLPAYKVVYAYTILGLPLESIPQVLAQFDAATHVVGMRYVFREDRIQALMAGRQDPLAWVRWFGHLPKFFVASAALDRYFNITSWPPPYPLDLPEASASDRVSASVPSAGITEPRPAAAAASDVDASDSSTIDDPGMNTVHKVCPEEGCGKSFYGTSASACLFDHQRKVHKV